MTEIRKPGSQHVRGLYEAQMKCGRTHEEAVIEVFKIGAYSGGARGLTIGQAQSAKIYFTNGQDVGMQLEEALDEVFLAGFVGARSGAFA